ncbi:MAG: hypothetical protein RLZZ22_1370, partial [Pseudomonadota bacterium]
MPAPIDTAGAGAPATPHERAARIHFDYALSGILETDAQWQIQRCNQAGLSILQQSSKDLQSQTLDRFLLTVGCTDVQPHFLLLQEQGICHSVLRLPGSGGAVQWLELSSIQAEDQLYIHFFDDVTLRHEQIRAQEAARAAAEDANRAKSAFLANMSHELRTPLNGILGLTQLCLMDELPLQTRQHLDKVARSGQTLLRMLNDLLDFSRIESGKMAYERAPFDLWELLEELAATVSHLALGKPLEIAFLLDPGTPRWLVGDRFRLQQVLINLLGNAVKFTAQGEVALEISWTQGLDESAVDSDEGHLRLAVRDTGPGLDAATLARLFQPFTQADDSTTRRFGGTGLGLAISRQLARGMGGELHASSQVGQGSCFQVQLPLRRDPAAPAHHGQAPGKVAVSSDRPLTRQALHQLVRSVGGEVIDGHADDPSGVAPSACIIDLDATAASTWSASFAARCTTLLLTDAQDAGQWRQRTRQQPASRVVTRPLTPAGLLCALTPAPSAASARQDWDLPD